MKVTGIVLQSRSRQATIRPALAFADIRLILALPFYFLLAWLVPERHWPRLCRWLVSYKHPTLNEAVLAGALPAGEAKLIGAELDGHRLEHYFQYLREYFPGGWRSKLVLEGRQHLEQATAAGRGAILWVGHTVFHGLVLKKSLAEAGFRLNHFSRPEHGFSKTRFGIAFLNPIRSRVEDRYLRRRIVIERGREERAVRAAARELAANGLVSITAGDWEGRQIAHIPMLGGSLPLATGAPALALAAGALLLPVFVIRKHNAIHVLITAPIDMGTPGSRDERVKRAMIEYAARLEPVVRDYPSQWRGWSYLRPPC